MDGKEFWKVVHVDERLEWLGSGEKGEPDIHGGGGSFLDEDTVFVNGPGGCFAIPIKTVLSEEYTTLMAILLGVRQPTVLSHMTRIVGYFSRLKDWNKSKIAELRDRRKAYDRQAVPCEE